ncbi:hypothetical protein JX265_004554 [Neoarthrinium moseri]|uniref:Acyl-CoA desaturase n=1 Tax=Neoarthrinium moseri TaxID=1658444 RepID=A0A9P9WR82_9PEZI|nr:uncharacterized protein JN550_008126 [Neoarthrinium moseri]KAI1851022.1 hypothetical protein JX266_003687 [Neoarthrinium moseri]KAI1865868.1 hypothetical protein JN550_008126 [Neoarthrinium moseri]KAI1875496.1 hypothetical protein JX265_004554 [Neoarthrinium moseri]
MATKTSTTTVTDEKMAATKTYTHISEQPMTWSNWYQHIDWFKTGLLVFIPLVACYWAYYTPLQRPTLIFSVLLHLWAGIGITAGYHRLWSHRSYTATLPLQLFLGFGGASALEGSIRYWSWGHRAHHRFTDTEKDPYTVSKGLWHAHMGWLLLRQDYKKHGRTDISDLSNDPFVVWQHKHYAAISIFFAWVMPTLVAGLGWGDWKGGLIYAGVLRVVTVQQSSFTINSLGHYLGDQPFDDRHSPRDHWISSLFSLGEGYHNFHHEFPTDYRNTTRWLTYDPNKWCINTWKWLGLASDLRTFSQNEIDKGRLQQEQKKLDRKLGRLDWGRPVHGLPVMEWDEFLEASQSRALIAVAGLAHDVTDFIDEHPGGKALIASAIGRDATALFNGGVYDHSNAARNLLAKYRVGIIRGGGEVEIWKQRAVQRLDKIRDYDYSIVGKALPAKIYTD